MNADLHPYPQAREDPIQDLEVIEADLNNAGNDSISVERNHHRRAHNLRHIRLEMLDMGGSAFRGFRITGRRIICSPIARGAFL